MIANSKYYLTPDWPAASNVHCLVTTRLSANLALHVFDDPESVKLNRQRLFNDLGDVPVQWLQQVHGTQVFIAKEGDIVVPPSADAIYARTINKACAVLTADCLPVFFSDLKGKEVAVAHAGWRGLLAGVLENTLACFKAETKNIIAYLGPAIGPCHFEVGDEVRYAFLNHELVKAGNNKQAYIDAFTPSAQDSKWMADLYQLATLKLLATGVTQVFGGEHCTYCGEEKFYSYRRNNNTGRFASLIWLS